MLPAIRRCRSARRLSAWAWKSSVWVSRFIMDRLRGRLPGDAERLCGAASAALARIAGPTPANARRCGAGRRPTVRAVKAALLALALLPAAAAAEAPSAALAQEVQR